MLELLRSARKNMPEPSAEDIREFVRVLRGGTISKPGALLQMLRSAALTDARPERFSVLRDFLMRTGGIDIATIQIACDPGKAVLAEMAKEVAKDGKTLTRVRVERALAGGIRVFRGGTLRDVSWKGRVRHLIQLVGSR